MTIAAWHRDPTGRHELRWWDGSRWTEHVSNGGLAGFDPMAPLAPPAATPTTAMLHVQPNRTQPAPNVRRTRLIAAGAAAVVALALGVIVVTNGGDDKRSSTATDPTTDRTEATTPRTTAPPTTAAVTVPLSTLPPDTSAPATTLAPVLTTVPALATSVPAPPTAPPPVIAVASTDDLIAALPSATDLPAGWIASGDPPDTTVTSSSGISEGLCGGDNSAQRALNANMIGYVSGPEYALTSVPGYFYVDLYSFGTPEDAAAFMSLTATQGGNCTAGLQYQLPDGDGPGQWPGFSPSSPGVVWNLSETVYVATSSAPGAEEAFQLALFNTSTTRDGGIDYAETEIDVMQYERHGRIVITYDLYAQCCHIGFGDIDPTRDYQPTTAELAAWIDMLRPGIVTRLQTRGVL